MSTHFPATYSTLSAKALASYLSTQYVLNEVVELNFICRGLNDTYIVTCGADEKYVFRIYRANWRSRNDIAYEVDALAHLRKEDVEDVLRNIRNKIRLEKRIRDDVKEDRTEQIE
jgi:Ser/Thr protein kinase RdoA (MazF antagonist)